MGIVYKVKPEIIEFILEQKRNNPRLSCRSLIEVVKNRFDVFISKSAINKIIKAAGLSNSVGRKKKSLTQPRVIQAESKIKSLPQKKEKFLPREKQPPKLLSQEKEQKQPAIELPEIKLPAKSQAITERSEEIIESEPEPIEIKEEEIFDSMGSFFLKAAEFELADKPILSKILDDDIRKDFPKGLGFIGNTVLYLPCFAVKGLNEISRYDGKGLWVLAGQRKTSLDLISKYLKQLQEAKGISWAIHSKSTQVFQEAGFLKVFLEDDTSFYIDAQFRSVWTQPNTLSDFSSTSYKTISYVNDLFLKNISPIILFTASGYNSFSKVISEFILACEAIPDKRIVKIELYDVHKKEMQKFLDVPSSFKRYFIFGFWPWQKEFIELIKQENRPIDSCYIEDINRDIYYNEGKMELVQHFIDKRLRLRFVLLKDSPVSPARMGIVTNISEDKSAKEIIQLYLRRWPNMEEAYQEFLKKAQSPIVFNPQEDFPKEASQIESSHNLETNSVDIKEDFNYLLDHLNKYVQRHFFPSIYKDVDFPVMRQRFYSLPARLKREKDRFLITLLIPDGYEFYKDLIYAIKRLNESDIRDNSQAKIYFALFKQ